MVLDDMPKRALRCVFDAMSRRQLISEKNGGLEVVVTRSMRCCLKNRIAMLERILQWVLKFCPCH